MGCYQQRMAFHALILNEVLLKGTKISENVLSLTIYFRTNVGYSHSLVAISKCAVPD